MDPHVTSEVPPSTDPANCIVPRQILDTFKSVFGMVVYSIVQRCRSPASSMPLCDSDDDDFETRPAQSSQQISGFPQGQSQFGAGSQRSNLPSSQQPLPAQQHNVRHPEAVVTGGGGLDSSPNLFDQVFGPDITALASSSNKRSSWEESMSGTHCSHSGGHNAVGGQATKRFQPSLPPFPPR